MLNYKLIQSIFFLSIFGLLLPSCGKENDPKKTISLETNTSKFDYFIEGEIQDKLWHFKQFNYEWTNVSNKYFVNYKETWLQAYNDSLNHEGKWKIRLHNMDIEKIDLPYTLTQSQGTVEWNDTRVDNIIAGTEYCQGIDNGCTFMLSPERGKITVTKVSNKIIEGQFNGKAILTRTGSAPGQDANLYHDIKNGKFKIKYRVE